MKLKNLMLILKGFCVGGSMLVPGVSGGSMAIILGIYDNLILAASNFFKTTKKSLSILSLFLFGSVIGFFVVANPLTKLIAWNEKLMMYFFIGAVIGSIPMILKKAHSHKMEFRSIFYIVFGLFIMWLISQVPKNLFSQTEGVMGIIMQATGGFLSATALILPGISISYLLVVMGIYEYILTALSSFNILALLPFGIGLLIGIVMCIKLLAHLLQRHPKPTYLVILGFIIGSVVEIFPGMPNTYWEWLMGILFFAAGFFAIALLSRHEN